VTLSQALDAHRRRESAARGVGAWREALSCAITVALAVALAGVPVVAQQPPPRDVSPPRATLESAGTGAIVGRVVDADSGAPLRRVEIVAAHAGRPLLTTFTDDEGRFALRDVAAGVWLLTAGKTGYVRQGWSQQRPGDAPWPSNVAPGVTLTADFSLVRAAAIGGRIYDEYGEPLSGVRVEVLRARMSQHKRHLQAVGEGDFTDDTGSFRIHGLPPGEYFVTASLRVAPIESIIQTTYAPTYYPGTGNFAEAQRIVLSRGADVAVDFPVAPYRTARVSGTVIAASGSPADAFLNLTAEAGELGVPLGVGGATLPDGTFTIPDVPPGTYTLTAELKGGGASEIAAVPLTVYGDDVSGITLVTAPPATIAGSIALEDGIRGRPPADVSVVARSIRAGGEATFSEPMNNAFQLTAPVGPFRLFVEPPAGWVVRSIVIGDADATDTAIDLRGQRDVPARIVLSNRISGISGTVMTLDGRGRARGASVVVFPDDAARWSPPSRFVRTTVAGADGTFSIAGLPPAPGYLAVAVAGLEDGEGEDPEFLARIRDLGARFDLAEGENRIVDVRVIPR
jgi:hypothetical protein